MGFFEGGSSVGQDCVTANPEVSEAFEILLVGADNCVCLITLLKCDNIGLLKVIARSRAYASQATQ